MFVVLFIIVLAYIIATFTQAKQSRYFMRESIREDFLSKLRVLDEYKLFQELSLRYAAYQAIDNLARQGGYCLKNCANATANSFGYMENGNYTVATWVNISASNNILATIFDEQSIDKNQTSFLDDETWYYFAKYLDAAREAFPELSIPSHFIELKVNQTNKTTFIVPFSDSTNASVFYDNYVNKLTDFNVTRVLFYYNSVNNTLSIIFYVNASNFDVKFDIDGLDHHCKSCIIICKNCTGGDDINKNFARWQSSTQASKGGVIEGMTFKNLTLTICPSLLDNTENWQILGYDYKKGFTAINLNKSLCVEIKTLPNPIEAKEIGGKPSTTKEYKEVYRGTLIFDAMHSYGTCDDSGNPIYTPLSRKIYVPLPTSGVTHVKLTLKPKWIWVVRNYTIFPNKVFGGWEPYNENHQCQEDKIKYFYVDEGLYRESKVRHTFILSQNGYSFIIHPIRGTQDVSTYYSPFKEDKTSVLYLYYDESNDELSLVMHHNNDSSDYARINFDFTLTGNYGNVQPEPKKDSNDNLTLSYGRWEGTGAHGGILRNFNKFDYWSLQICLQEFHGIDKWEFLTDEQGLQSIALNKSACLNISIVSPLKVVDVAFIIDTSGSMDNEISDVQSKVSNLVDQLKPYNPRYMLVTIPANGAVCVKSWTSDANAFKSDINSLNAHDECLGTSYQVCDEECAFGGITKVTGFRNNTYRIIVVLTDACGCGDMDAARNHIINNNIFLIWVGHYSGDECTEVDGSCCPGNNAKTFADNVGGVFMEICKLDFTNVINTIVKEVKSKEDILSYKLNVTAEANAQDHRKPTCEARGSCCDEDCTTRYCICTENCQRCGRCSGVNCCCAEDEVCRCRGCDGCISECLEYDIQTLKYPDIETDFDFYINNNKFIDREHLTNNWRTFTALMDLNDTGITTGGCHYYRIKNYGEDYLRVSSNSELNLVYKSYPFNVEVSLNGQHVETIWSEHASIGRVEEIENFPLNYFHSLNEIEIKSYSPGIIEYVLEINYTYDPPYRFLSNSTWAQGFVQFKYFARNATTLSTGSYTISQKMHEVENVGLRYFKLFDYARYFVERELTHIDPLKNITNNTPWYPTGTLQSLSYELINNSLLGMAKDLTSSDLHANSMPSKAMCLDLAYKIFNDINIIQDNLNKTTEAEGIFWRIAPALWIKYKVSKECMSWKDFKNNETYYACNSYLRYGLDVFANINITDANLTFVYPAWNYNENATKLRNLTFSFYYYTTIPPDTTEYFVEDTAYNGKPRLEVRNEVFAYC